MWIDGKECEAIARETIDSDSPTHGKTLTTLPRARREDVDLAVKSARRAFEGPWKKLGGADRASILWKVGEILLAKAEELARLETLDTGKPITNALAVDIPRSA